MSELTESAAYKLGAEHAEQMAEYARFIEDQGGKPTECYLIVMGQIPTGVEAQAAYERAVSEKSCGIIYAESGDPECVAEQLRKRLLS